MAAKENLPIPDERSAAALEISRRRFLALLAASAAFGAAGCTSPEDRGKVVPYTKTPPQTITGRPDYYASTFQEGLYAHAVLVKTREGRPVHIEGNDLHPAAQAKTNLRAIADVLSLYDPDRLFQPTIHGEQKSWERAQKDVAAVLQQAKSSARPLLLVTPAVISPTKKKLIAAWRAVLPALTHVSWEPACCLSAFRAMNNVYGQTVLPRCNLEQAEVLLALGADPLGVAGDAAENIRRFSKNRQLERADGKMSRLYAVEGRMSLSGMNADHRLALRPSRIAEFAFCLAGALHENFGVALPQGVAPEALGRLEEFCERSSLEQAVVQALLRDLAAAQGGALVLTGSELPQEAHAAGHLLNEMLGARRTLIDYDTAADAPVLTAPEELAALIKEAEQGKFEAVFFWETNPCYDAAQGTRLKQALKRLPFSASMSLIPDETSAACSVFLPVNHWLESWGDFSTARNVLCLRQAIINPLFGSKQGEDLVLSWLAALGAAVPAEYRDYLRARWQEEVYPAAKPASPAQDFSLFWNAALHDGFVVLEGSSRRPVEFKSAAAAAAAAAAKQQQSGLELMLFADSKLHDGRYANNGWLQELPDPVTKVVWNNPLSISPADAAALGVKEDELVELSAGGETIRVPVLVQPGQAKGVVCAALGYGRETGSVASRTGRNFYRFLADQACFVLNNVRLLKTGEFAAVARAQTYDLPGNFRRKDLELAQAETLAEYRNGAELRQPPQFSSLYSEHAYPDARWSMVIDLNSCVGCGACTLACQSENNIPVVGEEQVAKGREMHWIRVDRYYLGSAENPEVRVQPLACQHCEDAPCENVCPVAATNHSPDGINQMTYNRCIGTRYCANNCPYKVRRFNYFDFTKDTPKPQEMVFNPEVTVRPRGVMEKCTFCIQRIACAKWRAKAEGRAVKDGEIKTACQAACPAGAIVFGNLNDPQSEVSKLSRNSRRYKILAELGVKPVVTYLKKIRNKAETG